MGARIDDAVWGVDDGGRVSSRRLKCESRSSVAFRNRGVFNSIFAFVIRSIVMEL